MDNASVAGTGSFTRGEEFNPLKRAIRELDYWIMNVASVVAETQASGSWRPQHSSFGHYVDWVALACDQKRSTVYYWFGVARSLRRAFPDADLSRLGFEKGKYILRVNKECPKVAKDILSKAMDSSINASSLEQIAIESGFKKSEKSLPDEKWMSADFSSYFSHSEKKELQDAKYAATHADPPISRSLPPAIQRKEVLLRWAREFLASSPVAESEDDGA